MTENEFRVRPVQRFNLTHYQSDGRTGSVRSLGEFDSIEKAEELGVAMNLLVPGSTFATILGRPVPNYPAYELGQALRAQEVRDLEYVIVQAHTFEVANRVYYAYSAEEAQRTKLQAEVAHGAEFRVYTRPRPAGDTDEPPKSMSCGPAHTNYPSRYAIGDKVLRIATDLKQEGSGILHHYPAEAAEVWSIHFYPGKVTYDVTFPSGRTMERVDSIELADLT